MDKITRENIFHDKIRTNTTDIGERMFEGAGKFLFTGLFVFLLIAAVMRRLF